MQPGGDPFDLGVWQVPGQRVGQGRVAVPIARAGAAQVPLERSAADQVGDGELVEHGGAEVGTGPQRRDEGVPACEGNEPPEARRREERLTVEPK